MKDFIQKASDLEEQKEKLEFELDCQTNIKNNLDLRIKEDQRLKKVAEEALNTYQMQTDLKMKKMIQQNLENGLALEQKENEIKQLKTSVEEIKSLNSKAGGATSQNLLDEKNREILELKNQLNEA